MIATDNRTKNLRRLEQWGLITMFVLAVIFFVSKRLGVDGTPDKVPFKVGFDKINMPFNYYKNFVFPVFIEFFIFNLGAFWFMNFYVVPILVRKEAVLKNFIYLGLIFLTLAIVDGITDTFTHAYRFVPNSGYDLNKLIIDNLRSPVHPFLLLGLYTLLKYTGLYFISNSRSAEAKYRFVQRDAINAFVVWLLSMFVLIVFGAGMEITVGWGIIGPVGILIYCYSFFSLIPNSLSKKRAFLRYMLKVTLLLLLFLFPVFMVAVVSTRSENIATAIAAFHLAFQLLITAPVTWALFLRFLRGNEEMMVLQKELGKSNANLDFLRSQINPHFLFNALNTIYGTAIQEQAERTAEGIQKLGDMMRFMLQENMQEKISLSREIEYLHNYISLQKLRTDINPGIQIQAHITDTETGLQIAPMLLIPFVENAFKHGISFREPSQVKVTLQIKNNTLHFEVSNSKHLKQDSDPEKDKSGVGLENVKQRLQLLYTNKHYLHIDETGKEFIVQLTIQLAA